MVKVNSIVILNTKDKENKAQLSLKDSIILSTLLDIILGDLVLPPHFGSKWNVSSISLAPNVSAITVYKYSEPTIKKV